MGKWYWNGGIIKQIWANGIGIVVQEDDRWANGIEMVVQEDDRWANGIGMVV